MSDLAFSRRAVTRAIAALPAFAIPAVAGATSRALEKGDGFMNMHVSIKSADVGSAAWDAAMCAHLNAAGEEEVYETYMRDLLAEEEKALAAIPHVEIGPDPASGAILTTADATQVHLARRTAEYARPTIPQLGESYDARKLLATAVDARDAQIRAVREQLGMSAAEDRWEEIGDTAYEAKWALMKMPAPHLPALLWKLEVLFEVDDDGTPSWSLRAIEQTLADCRRLLHP